jgi:iron complex transport system ATP-binding protein
MVQHESYRYGQDMTAWKGGSSVALLETHELSIGYGRGAQGCPIAGPLDLSIHAGKLICLLGPNGAGKSTLLRTLSGLQHPLSGSIRVGDSTRLNPARLARLISLVLTDPVKNSNLTVHHLVSLGRYPYSGWLGKLDPIDLEVVARALAATGMESYADRKMSTLSDGESQKVMLARALAQDTPLMMLDEPTAHLDLPSRIQLMQLLHRLAGQTGKGILVSTHELDLALQVADEVWLLQKGGRLDKGIPEQLVLDGTFEAVFDKEGILFDRVSGSFHIRPAQVSRVRFSGEGVAAFWTKRALRRLGIDAEDPGSAIAGAWVGGTGGAGAEVPVVEVSEIEGQVSWRVQHEGSIHRFDSLDGLLGYLSAV